MSLRMQKAFRLPKTAECIYCKTPIPPCVFDAEICNLPSDEEPKPCDKGRVNCPMAMCFSCRINLRRQVERLNAITDLLEAEAEEILKKPYKRQFIYDSDGISASMPELPGCFSCGTNLQEADDNLHEAAVLWLSAAIEDGEEVPQPDIEAENIDQDKIE